MPLRQGCRKRSTKHDFYHSLIRTKRGAVSAPSVSRKQGGKVLAVVEGNFQCNHIGNEVIFAFLESQTILNPFYKKVAKLLYLDPDLIAFWGVPGKLEIEKCINGQKWQERRQDEFVKAAFYVEYPREGYAHKGNPHGKATQLRVSQA